MRKHAKLIVIGALLIATLATPIALGAGEGQPLDGGARNPSPNESVEYNRETEIIAENGTYGTRQSNKSNNGGGAIYGCRSGAGGTPANNEPCIRANNLNQGFAFEYETDGTQGGTINSRRAGDGSRPFATNMTGVATGLNADRVDGKDATDIVNDVRALNPFAQVTAGGAPGQARGVQPGGITKQAGDGNYNVVFAGDLSACALSATVTGTAAGQVTVTPTVASPNTTVDVRTFNGAGAAADRPFHLTATC